MIGNRGMKEIQSSRRAERTNRLVGISEDTEELCEGIEIAIAIWRGVLSMQVLLL